MAKKSKAIHLEGVVGPGQGDGSLSMLCHCGSDLHVAALLQNCLDSGELDACELPSAQHTKSSF